MGAVKKGRIGEAVKKVYLYDTLKIPVKKVVIIIVDTLSKKVYGVFDTI